MVLPKLQVENELQKICDTILKLLDQGLIPKATQAESKVFYQKMPLRTGCQAFGFPVLGQLVGKIVHFQMVRQVRKADYYRLSVKH